MGSIGSRTIFISIFFLSLRTFLFAQTTMGVEGGLSNNTYQTNIVNRAATVLTGVSGFSIDLPFRYKIYSWLYISITPGLVQKGYSMNRTDSLYGEYDRHINSYLQLPFGISLVHTWQRLRGTLDPGLYSAYWLSGRVKGSTANIFSVTDNTNGAGQSSEQFLLSNYNDRYSFLSQRDNRWEWGWYLGLGLQYHLSGPCWLTANGRYFQSLTSQGKMAVSPIPAYNRTRIFSLGVQWELRRSKKSI